MKIFRRATLKVLQVVRSRGVFAGLKMLINHLHGERPIQSFDEIKAYFHGKNCLEIGGPSFIFQPKSILPVYVLMNNIDNVNFSSKTVWGDNVLAPNYPRNKLDRQFIPEATDLRGIEDKSYDCVFSSHVLEHVANPLRALFEWKRVLKDGGVLLLVVPHKEATFDHNRQVTKLSHLIQDYTNELDEHDLSHLEEILKSHDLSMDPEAGTYENFVIRSRDNFNNRCLHHHVFTTESVIYMIDHVGLKILLVATHHPYHIVILCQKMSCVSQNQEIEFHVSNLRLLDKDASWRKSSCFTLDSQRRDGLLRVLVYTITYCYPPISRYIGGGIRRVIQLHNNLERYGVEMYFVGVQSAIRGFFGSSPRIVPVASLLEGKGHYIRKSMLFRVVSFFYYVFMSVIGGIRATVSGNQHIVLAPGETFVITLASYIIARITKRQLIIISHTIPCYGHLWGYEACSFDFSKLNSKSTDTKSMFRFLKDIGMKQLRALFNAVKFTIMFKVMRRSYVITLNPLITVALKRMLGTEKIYEVYPGNGIELMEDLSGKKLFDGIVAGVLSPEKGLFDAIRAWKQVTKEFPESKLAVAGWAVNKQVINRAIKLINDLGLDKNIKILNNLSEGVDHSTLVNYISKSKLLIYPSRRDVWPLTVCEALGSGVPVVAYDIPTFRYSFNTRGVIKVPLNSISGIAQSICKLLRNNEKYHEVFREATSYAESLTWKNIARKEKRIYLEILKNARVNRGRGK